MSFGHEVIVANVRELRAISHSNRKSDIHHALELAAAGLAELHLELGRCNGGVTADASYSG